jgi:hypothetical protein
MLIHGGRTFVMRSFKANPPTDPLYQFIDRLKKSGKHFNVICVAVANKLARIAYAYILNNTQYNAAGRLK